MDGLKKLMIVNLIPKFKIGDCSIKGCGRRDTEGRKVGKNFVCIFHYNESKKKELVAKANVKQKVRSLITYERQEGILDSVQELILDLDRVVSRYVRLAAMGLDHKCQCYTCSTKRKWQDMQCGHFIQRSHLGLRFELANLRVQCPNCNVGLHGNTEVFAKNLEREQKGIVEWLYQQSKEVSSPTRQELKELLINFQLKLKTVEIKLK